MIKIASCDSTSNDVPFHSPLKVAFQANLNHFHSGAQSPLTHSTHVFLLTLNTPFFLLRFNFSRLRTPHRLGAFLDHPPIAPSLRPAAALPGRCLAIRIGSAAWVVRIWRSGWEPSLRRHRGWDGGPNDSHWMVQTSTDILGELMGFVYDIGWRELNWKWCSLPVGNLLHCYWTWPIIDDLPSIMIFYPWVICYIAIEHGPS